MAKQSAKVTMVGPDFSALMQAFDPLKMMQTYNDMLRQYSEQGVDFSQLADNQQKNLSALAEANRVMLESTQAVIQRQTELLQETGTQAVTAAKELSETEPTKLAAKQAELAAQAYEKAIETMREISQTVSKANQEAMETLEKRWRQVLQDVKKQAENG